MTGTLLTLDQIRELQSSALNRLIQQAGNPTHLARMLELPVSTVHGWSQRGRISKEGAKRVEACSALNFTANELRPDTNF